MFHRCVALLLGVVFLILAREARADEPKVAAVPSIRAPAPISVLTRDVPVAAVDTQRKGLPWTILRTLGERRVPSSPRRRDDGPRDPRLIIEQSKVRDATSLGASSGGLTGAGAILAAFGIGLHGTMALRRGRKTPFKFGPMASAGGVGILFGAKF